MLPAFNILTAKQLSIVSEGGTTRTLSLTDEYKMISCENASDLVITIPNNTSVAFPIEGQVAFTRKGAGNVTFLADSGVTINSYDGALSIAGQYATCALYKSGTNEWLLSGALE